MTRTLYTTALVFCLGLAACGEDAPESAPETPTSEAPTSEATAAPAAPANAGEFVTVAAEGTRFDPAVQLSEIAPDTWICDMGTVHYAATERGNGACPICQMALVQHP